MSRYKHIIDLINKEKPRTICEIGTWNGDRALEMCGAALRHNKDVHYFGFDLFTSATPETDQTELNVKKHHSVMDVSSKLKAFQKAHPGFKFQLTEGNTNQSLRKAAYDFAFIDGGHSIDTIYNDYQKLSESKFILLDDYYSPDDKGLMPDIEYYGCNRIAATLELKLLPTKDRVKGGGFVQLAYVSGN